MEPPTSGALSRRRSGGSWCRAIRGRAVLGRRKADLWNVGESCEEGPPGNVGV
ncbi:hypothetical protein DY000_02060775 [Brassica cretica]|uniref:Uncharacterized protein n=1 Tax=Brassica cretica TaxID=69181 RepID=A0ABQ7AWK0_BRACR|nr:hypothetical protein DY000_02060775 [Brassica cretica]